MHELPVRTYRCFIAGFNYTRDLRGRLLAALIHRIANRRTNNSANKKRVPAIGRNPFKYNF